METILVVRKGSKFHLRRETPRGKALGAKNGYADVEKAIGAAKREGKSRARVVLEKGRSGGGPLTLYEPPDSTPEDHVAAQ